MEQGGGFMEEKDEEVNKRRSRKRCNGKGEEQEESRRGR